MSDTPPAACVKPVELSGSPEVPSRRVASRTARAWQSSLAVAVVQAVLLPLHLHGMLNAPAFGLCTLVLSAAAVFFFVHQSALPRKLAPEVDEHGKQKYGDRPGDSLDRSLKRLRRGMRERETKLKAALEAARTENIAGRIVTERLSKAQSIARLGSWEWGRDAGRVTLAGDVFLDLGIDVHAFSARPAAIQSMIHKEDRLAFRRWLVKFARRVPAQAIDLRILGKGGVVHHVHVLGEPMLETSGRLAGVVGTMQDTTERTQAIQQIHRLAYYDVLTELPNRSRFHEKLAETLVNAKRSDKGFAIMFLDLDQFKRINDTLGHAVGDDLLRIIAQRLTRVLRLDDLAHPSKGKSSERDVCRQGGDEFIMLLNGVTSEQDASRAAQRLLEALAQPIVIGSDEVFISASIGIALYPRDGDDLDALLKNADVAMYHAKGEGRNRFCFYDDSMRAATARRLSLEHDLRKAIEGEQFELYYQPQIDVGEGTIVGIEALIRWNHPTLGLLSPGHFIGVAEEAGIIMDIWEWVLVTVLIQHNARVQQGLPAIPVGVNLSSVQFSDPALASRVAEIARVVGVSPHIIEFEVTESMLMVDFDTALQTLAALRAMGVKIAIDDFGTGYSSLSYLRRLPLDKLKLDQSFTRDAAENAQDAAITAAIVAMAQSLKLTVVAEGVETQAQLDFLASLGCTTMQGYLLGRPMPADAIARLLQAKSARQELATAALDGEWQSIVKSMAHASPHEVV